MLSLLTSEDEQTILGSIVRYQYSFSRSLLRYRGGTDDKGISKAPRSLPFTEKHAEVEFVEVTWIRATRL